MCALLYKRIHQYTDYYRNTGNGVFRLITQEIHLLHFTLVIENLKLNYV